MSKQKRPFLCKLGLHAFGEPETGMYGSGLYHTCTRTGCLHTERFIPNKPFRCKIGWHKSNKDYGMKGLGGPVFSECKYCHKTLWHPLLKWVGGGN